MASKPPQQAGVGGGESLAAQIAGMSKNQLYEIMGQMKNLIEQNPQQARQILIDNPKLTKALFQAQIMLGMVQPPKVMPSFQQAPSQSSQQSTHLGQQNSQPLQSTTIQAVGSQSEYAFQPQVPLRQQQQKAQQPISVPLTVQSKSTPPVQAKGVPLTSQPPPSLPSNPILPPPPPIPPHSILQTHNMPLISGQSTLPLSQPLQRPNFPQPLHSQMPPGLGFQVASSQQHLLSQSTFHPSAGGSFPLGQSTLTGQPSRQQLYQGSSEFSLLPGPQPLPTMTSQPSPRPPQLTAEMEQALLQQVMSLTPEQISQLPPEHRNHVIQIQQMYRSCEMSKALAGCFLKGHAFEVSIHVT